MDDEEYLTEYDRFEWENRLDLCVKFAYEVKNDEYFKFVDEEFRKEFTVMKFKKLNPRAILPKNATNGSAGYDIHVCIDHEVTIQPNECVMLGTGFALWIENPNFCAMCIPRSGLGAKKGIVLGNLTGLIDSDYQGEWHIPVWNRGTEPVTIYPHDKICQCVFVPVVHPVIEEVDDFEEETKRAEGSFGSTGVHYN